MEQDTIFNLASTTRLQNLVWISWREAEPAIVLNAVFTLVHLSSSSSTVENWRMWYFGWFFTKFFLQEFMNFLSRCKQFSSYNMLWHSYFCHPAHMVYFSFTMTCYAKYPDHSMVKLVCKMLHVGKMVWWFILTWTIVTFNKNQSIIWPIHTLNHFNHS